MRTVEPALTDRLARLHTNARRCCAGYRRAKDDLRRNKEFLATVELLAALADEERLAMVVLLRQYGELCACEIEATFDLSHSTVAHHLNRLVEAGLVTSRKDGKWSYYRLADSVAARLESCATFLARKQATKCCCC